MHRGYIAIWRKILDWEWYSDLPTRVLFLHLLIKANHSPKQWKGISIEPGEVLTGRFALAKETGLSEQQVRSSLSKLKSTNDITIKTTNKNSIIKLNNYDSHRPSNQQDNQQITNKQPTNNQQITTTKKEKNVKNEENDNNSIESIEPSVLTPSQSMKNFITSVREKDSHYQSLLEKLAEGGIEEDISSRELDKFLDYWCELTKSGTKQRWETEKTFEVRLRLKTWFRNYSERASKSQTTYKKFNVVHI